MGYTGSYSLGARCCTEAVGMCIVIFLGESVIANEVLASTKGRGFGFGWVSFGFGLAFFVPILMFDYISAHFNPAMLIAQWVLGRLSVADFFALAGCEVGGAFVGAVLVWLTYIPHFKTVPEPRSDNPADDLLRNRNGLDPATLNIVSYNAHPPPPRNWRAWVKDVPFYLDPDLHDRHHVALVEKALGRDSVTGPKGQPHLLRRRSVQVCDLHNRIKDLTIEDLFSSTSQPQASQHSASAALDPESLQLNCSEADLNDPKDPVGTLHPNQPHTCASWNPKQPHSGPWSPRTTKTRKHLDALYEAAIRADQNAKLSIFATRPAIPAPVFNWLTEFLATTMLIGGALLISAQGSLQLPVDHALYRTLNALYIGLFIVVLVLGAGGPTGAAMNPARDFGPRFAHWLLPIAGKGPSEWYYAGIPFTASLVGGLAGGGLFQAINQLNHSQT